MILAKDDHQMMKGVICYLKYKARIIYFSVIIHVIK